MAEGQGRFAPFQPKERPPALLVVDEPGAFIAKHSERLRVTVQGELREERPLFELEHLLIGGGGVSLSAEAVRACAERGIGITFLTRSGRPYAGLVAAELVGTVQTRRQQLLAYLDERGVWLMRQFAEGKLLNQAALLKYMAKYRRETKPEVYELAREAAREVEEGVRALRELRGRNVESLREAVLAIEAQAAVRYWEAARALVATPEEWPGRVTRGATDIANMALNYGYGMLYAQVERAAILAGLDPFAGFLHADRSGRPSLVMDLIEEFRQMAVDRPVFALFNRGVVLKRGEDGRLDEGARREIAARVSERLESEEPYEDGRRRLRTIIQLQARRVATFVRGEGAPYRPWVGRW